MNSKELLLRLDIVNGKLDALHIVLNSAEKGNFGLTKDTAKTPEWHSAKKQWSIYWNELRELNKKLNKIRKCIGYEIANGKRKPIYKYKD